MADHDSTQPDAPAALHHTPVPVLMWTYEKHAILMHLKSKRLYTVIAHAFTEADLRPVYVYRRLGATVQEIWTRPKEEFEDGRFELYRHADKVY